VGLGEVWMLKSVKLGWEQMDIVYSLQPMHDVNSRLELCFSDV